MTIQQILDKIDNFQLFVPAFQREYVWKRKNAKDLLNSLIKKHPTGTLLTWETNKPPELKGEKKYDPMQGAIKLILDGQQRISTLYMIIKGNIPPYYTKDDIGRNDVRTLCVNLENLDLEYYRPKSMDNNPRWVRLTDIFKNNLMAFNIINDLREIGEVSRDLEKTIHTNYNNIKLIEDREFVEQSIPITASIREAIDIFYIVNASGVNLTDAELALAQITGYWPEARKLFKAKLEELAVGGFVFNLDFIVYALLGVMYNIGTDMRKLHSIENKDKIKEVWELLENSVLDYVMNLLKSKAYVDHTKEINSVYALIAIIVYVYNKPTNKLTQDEINKVIKWFYYSQIRQRYISQLPQKLDVDIKTAVNSKNPFDELLNIIKLERPLEISKDEFIGATVQNALFNLMKFYFKSKHAVCLGTGIGLSKNMGKRYELENDHIFAWSILKKNGYSMNNRRKYSLAQEITNRAILTSTENRSKSAEETLVYLKEAKQNFPNALKLQLIPEDENLWKVENYEIFLEERRKLLAKELNSFLESITDTYESNGHMTYEEIVAAGEDEFHEFKQTLRWDVKETRINKKLEEVILKTIAAFNNKEGGMLIIGASDDGELIGLEDDYNCLKDGDKDKFEIHLRNLLNEAYSKEYTANNLVINFLKIDDTEICVIEIAKGIDPLYTKMTDSNGQKKEKFFIRSGNSSPELSSLSEINSYIKNHFG
jgi:uncharacterized protein with ParB-like and HNH nuclease domain